MFDMNTKRLIDYWRGLCGKRALPDRADVEPSGFVGLAHRVFIAELRTDGEIAFARLAPGCETHEGAPQAEPPPAKIAVKNALFSWLTALRRWAP